MEKEIFYQIPIPSRFSFKNYVKNTDLSVIRERVKTNDYGGTKSRIITSNIQLDKISILLSSASLMKKQGFSRIKNLIINFNKTQDEIKPETVEK